MGNVKFEYASGRISISDLLRAPVVSSIVPDDIGGTHDGGSGSGSSDNIESMLVLVPLELSKKIASEDASGGDDRRSRISAGEEVMELRVRVSRYAIL
jgi:hypothetical protein